MKQLLILVTTIMMSIFAHAASFNWTIKATQLVNHTSSQSAGLGTLAVGVDVSVYIVGHDATGASASSDYLLGTYSKTGSAGGFTASAQDGSTAFKTDGNFWSTTETYEFYFVYTDESGKWEYTSGVATGSPTSGAGSTIDFGGGRTSGSAAASGTWAPVPEPTSGLLLLIGVAGLALRRKRA